MWWKASSIHVPYYFNCTEKIFKNHVPREEQEHHLCHHPSQQQSVPSPVISSPTCACPSERTVPLPAWEKKWNDFLWLVQLYKCERDKFTESGDMTIHSIISKQRMKFYMFSMTCCLLGKRKQKLQTWEPLHPELELRHTALQGSLHGNLCPL